MKALLPPMKFSRKGTKPHPETEDDHSATRAFWDWLYDEGIEHDALTIESAWTAGVQHGRNVANDQYLDELINQTSAMNKIANKRRLHD